MKKVNVINDMRTKNDRATVLADYEICGNDDAFMY